MKIRLGPFIHIGCLLGLVGAGITLIVGLANRHYPLLLVGGMGLTTMLGLLLHQACNGTGAVMAARLEAEMTNDLVNGAFIATVASLSSGPAKKSDMEITEEEKLEESDFKKNRTHKIIH